MINHGQRRFAASSASARLRRLITFAFAAVAVAALSLIALRHVPSHGVQLARSAPRAPEPIRARALAHGEDLRGESPSVTDPALRARVAAAYGQLPLSFVSNKGQFDREVKFSSRGGGYELYLTHAEAVLSLSKHAAREDRSRTTRAPESEDVSPAPPIRSVLRMKMPGARREARASGEGRLPGRANYLIGGDPAKWRTGVSTFAAVRYEKIYPGVDLVYYGNQRQLEYDFRIAPHADPRRIRVRFEGAREVSLDSEGQLLVRADGGDLVQRKPFAYQTISGERREVSARYTLDARSEIGFALGEYDRTQPLVIDPVLSYASFLGGSGDDQANGVAVDSSGSAYITGQTSSTNFPTASPLQGAHAGFGTDVFVVKLNPAGTALVYSTYLGGTSTDFGYGIAVDAAGSAYVSGTTASADFPHTNGAPQSAKSGGFDAFVAKLDAGGSSLAYSTFIGGVNSEIGYGVGVDAAGNAYVAGSAASPSINGVALPKHGSPLYKSTDAGGAWSASNNGINDVALNSLTVDPTNSSTLYAAGSVVFKSTNGGGSWSPSPQLLFSATTPATPRSVSVDPSAPSILYAASTLGIYKSTNGGDSWAESDNGIAGSALSNYYVLVDPNSPATLYAGTQRGVFKSTNGGANWIAVNNFLTISPPTVFRLAFDPTNSNTLYAATSRGVFKSTNGGGGWTPASNGLPGSPSSTLAIASVVVDPAAPNTLYAASQFAGVFKSTDGGGIWSAVNNGLTVTVGGVTYTLSTVAIVINPLAPATLYAATNLGVYKTTDGGANWAASSGGLANKIVNDVVVDRTNPANVYAATSSGGEAFAAKIDAGGTSFGYLVYLGGDESDFARAVAVDAAGNAYLTGATDSSNFPVANAAQPASGGFKDAFVAKLSPGGALAYSTYLGGGDLDEAAAIAVDASGRAYVTGDTFSANFPTTETRKPRDTLFLDAFVTRLGASGSTIDYSFLLGGGDMDQGFGIAADADGSAYVTGATSSTDFPTAGSTQACSGFPGDAFITKLSPASTVVYSTCVGGGGEERGLAIASAGGAAYVVGVTASPNFPTTPSAPQGASGGGADAFVVKLQAGIDLALTMTDAPDPVGLGSDLTYTINVANLAELTATGVRLTDTLPAGASLVSANTTQGACSGAATITCDLGNINGGAQATVTITIKPPAVRNISNTASVSASESESNTTNNSATQNTVIDFTDLSVKAAALQTTVAAGGRVIYLFAVTNGGTIPANSVGVDIALPAEVTVVSCATTAGACGGAGNSRTVTLPSLAAGASQSISVVAAVNGGTANGTVLTATAHVAATTPPDPDAANNSASASATVAPNVIQSKLNGKIAFTNFGDGLYTMNDDGTNPVKIHAAANGNPFLPAWSPDGSRIVFLSELFLVTGPSRELRLVNADGSSPRVLASNMILNSRPTWSPDGASVAFIGRDSKSINVINAAGTPFETTLIPNLPILSNIVWSPDGTKFLFETSSGDLWTVNTDGSGQTPLNTDQNLFDTDPTWSPDGTQIMFLRRVTGSGSDGTSLYLMNADGTNAHQPPNFRGVAKRPVFSPDGQKIVFESAGSINGNPFAVPVIFKMNVDGTDVTRIPADGLGGSAPSWQSLPNPNPTPTPTPAPTYTISGRVLRPDGTVPLVSSTLNLTGSHTATAFTDAGGNYSFTLPAGNYTVTPSVSNLYTYSPASRTFNNLGANQPGADFTATQINYTIIGRVTDANGAPLPDIDIILNGGFPQVRSAHTGADGTYAFNSLAQNTQYTVSVSVFSRTVYNFLPDAVAFFSLPQSENIVNFVGTPKTSINFGSAQFGVGEGDGQATITITRTGNTSDVSSVSFTTADDPAAVRCDDTVNNHGSAYARCDYATTVSALTFAPGVTQMTVSVPLIDDAHVEGDETFQLRLFNVDRAGLGALSTASVLIHDNDAAPTPASANPALQSGFFVRQQYLDFFGREPDAGGFNAWKGTLDNCPDPFNTNPASPSANCDRVSVSTKFFRSKEFELKGGYVFNFYRVAFGRLPRYAEIIPDMASLTATNDDQFFDKKAAFTREFVQRQEFRLLYDALTNQQFVDALMGRYNLQQITTTDPFTPDNTANKTTLTRADLVSRLNSLAHNRAQVLRALADSNEVKAAEANSSFVAMQYFGYLRRDPDEGGYNDWLRTINANPNDIRSMVNGFMNSTEYRLRFGTP